MRHGCVDVRVCVCDDDSCLGGFFFILCRLLEGRGVCLVPLGLDQPLQPPPSAGIVLNGSPCVRIWVCRWLCGCLCVGLGEGEGQEKKDTNVCVCVFLMATNNRHTLPSSQRHTHVVLLHIPPSVSHSYMMSHISKSSFLYTYIYAHISNYRLFFPKPQRQPLESTHRSHETLHYSSTYYPPPSLHQHHQHTNNSSSQTSPLVLHLRRRRRQHQQQPR